MFAERSLRLMDADALTDFLGLALVGTMVHSQYLKPKDTQRLLKTAGYPYFGVPGMGDNLVVKVHYALGSRKR